MMGMPEKLWIKAYDEYGTFCGYRSEEGHLTNGATEYTRSALTTELADALEDMVAAIHQADWNNGVKDQSGGLDEGEYLIGQVVEKAKTALKKIGRIQPVLAEFEEGMAFKTNPDETLWETKE